MRTYSKLSKGDPEAMHLVFARIHMLDNTVGPQLQEVLRVNNYLGAKILRGCDSSDLDVLSVDAFFYPLVQVLFTW